jgi:hypothetical protein
LRVLACAPHGAADLEPAALGGGQRVASAAGGLASILGMDGNSNPLDDVIGMAGKIAR